MNFCKIIQTSYKNGNKKDRKFVKQFWEWILKICKEKWYVIDRESKGVCSKDNPIKFSTKLIQELLLLQAMNLFKTNEPLAAATQVAFENCAPFKDCRTEINDALVDYAGFINIAMPMYNFIEYSDNYSGSSGSLWGFKRDDVVNNVNMNNKHNAPSFKYKGNLIGNTEADGIKKGVKIAVPLKYLSNFWRSLEMPLINCKVELPLKWIENCVLTTAEIGANTDAPGADEATFKITDAKR